MSNEKFIPGPLNPPQNQPYPSQGHPYSPHDQLYPPHYQQYPPQDQLFIPQCQPYPLQGHPYYLQNQPYPRQGQPYLPQLGINPANPPPQYGASHTIVVQPANTHTFYLGYRTYLNFTGAIILSCFVYWCCGCLFGLIAFILAMVGQSSVSNSGNQTAKTILISSYILSAVGLVTGIIFIIAIVIIVVTSDSVK